MSARVANNALDAWLSVRLQLCSALMVGGLTFSAVTFHVLAAKGVTDVESRKVFSLLDRSASRPEVFESI